MSYNIKKWLFLDDLRFPYVCPEKIKGEPYMASAYYYTRYSPFKDQRWDIVRNYDEFVEYIKNNGVENLLISYDHDLSIEHYQEMGDTISYDEYSEKTGYDCVKWLCDYCMKNNLKFPDYYIHSMNTVGKENIISYIENYKKHVENDQGTI
jgi:hypothetical protein